MNLFVLIPVAASLICCVSTDSSTGRPTNQNGVTNEELERISSQLYASDTNRADGLVLNLQNKTRPGDRRDKAQLPLFKEIPKDLFTRPTYSKLLALYDNYAVAVETPEKITNQELVEENDYMDAVLSTQVMKMARQFLVDKGLVDRDARKFKQLMKDIWFGFYSRASGNQGSSGFEHVFLGEQKNGISGLHSWIRFKLEEDAGNMNYLGYVKTLSAGAITLIEMPMSWKGNYKPITSIFIGGSPEFEMAIYSVCFMARPDTLCPVQSNGTRYQIQSHTSTFKGKRFVGSTYPTL